MPLLSNKSLRILRNALLTVVVLFCIVFGGGRLAAGYLMARLALTTGPNGPQTPAMLGVPFARVEIPSGPRRLDSYIVTAASSCTNPPVLLIYHGVQETISEWVKAQKFLYDHCVSSVIFDPTGSGNSSRPAAFEAIGEDSIAAYEFTVQRFPREPHLCPGPFAGKCSNARSRAAFSLSSCRHDRGQCICFPALSEKHPGASAVSAVGLHHSRLVEQREGGRAGSRSSACDS